MVIMIHAVHRKAITEKDTEWIEDAISVASNFMLKLSFQNP